MTTNQRIKEIRLALGLSQAKFAKAISISNGYIAGIELGNRNVNDRLIKLICITFNVREDWLRNGSGDMFNEHLTQSLELASSTFNELKPAYQEYIIKQIDQLLEIQQTENYSEPLKTIAELEEEYKKTILHSASKTTSPVSNTTEDTGRKNRAVGEE